MRFASCFVVAVLLATVSCKEKTDVELWVDGFQPKNVRFEIEDKGPMSPADVDALSKRGDIDGTLRLPEGTCPAPGCRVAIVSVFVHNMDADAQTEMPPVVRLKSPPGKPARLPIAFRGAQINKGRIGRIRWVVEMYPEEKSLTATLTQSVSIIETPSPAARSPAAPSPPSTSPASPSPASPSANPPPSSATTTHPATTTNPATNAPTSAPSDGPANKNVEQK